ncbi:MAG: DJ-1/PfpI family protein [Candidatus Omnitrophica bacterium]|nr:DJ-1/PfpI family protein [Candidatus Omnitrophota bacterium]
MFKRVLVPLAEGFEEIEALFPVDLLRRAEIEVVIAGLNTQNVKSAHGIIVTADTTLDKVTGNFDGVLLHGGNPGTQNLAASTLVSELIKQYFQQGKLIAAICGAPAGVVYPTGILKDKRATGFPGAEKRFGKDTIFVLAPVVVDGNILTSRGVGTAHAFGLAVIAYLLGNEKRDEISQRTLFPE